MKHLYFYTESMLGFSLGIIQNLVQPIEYQGSNVFVKVTGTKDIKDYLMSLQNIDHLEDIHIVNVSAKQGAEQDELEEMIGSFSDNLIRHVYWLDYYGTPVTHPNITYIRPGDNEEAVDAYLKAITSNPSYAKPLTQGALSFYWPIRAYFNHVYDNTTKQQTDILEAIYEIYGLEYVAAFSGTAILEEFYNTHRIPIDRYLEHTIATYVYKVKRRAITKSIEGILYTVVNADNHLNHVADGLIESNLAMNDKVVALIINQEYNSTRLTIRTSNVDAREVGAMFSDTPKGKYNATTVWVRGAQLTPEDIMTGIENMKAGNNQQ